MDIEEFLKTNPTKEKVAEILCETANYEHHNIKELWCYDKLCKKFGLTDDNFYEDTSELSDYEIKYIGVYNWKYKL